MFCFYLLLPFISSILSAILTDIESIESVDSLSNELPSLITKSDPGCKVGKYQLFTSKHRIRDIKSKPDPCPSDMKLANITSKDLPSLCKILSTCGDGKCSYINDFGNDSMNYKREFTICSNRYGCQFSFMDRGSQKLQTFICEIK